MEHSINTYITITPPGLFSSSYVQAKLAEVSFFVQYIYYVTKCAVLRINFFYYNCIHTLHPSHFPDKVWVLKRSNNSKITC